jgi:alpha-D-xyloside xylohydrolase
MKLTVLPFGFSVVRSKRVAFHDSFTAEPDEHFYGFGEKFTDFDKRGQRIQIWNYDCGGAFSERSYKNVPFFISTRNYGIFVDSTRAVDFDMVASNTAAFSIINPGDELDYYVIAGPDPKTIITRYAELVSFPVLPPKWSLGVWMSSGFQRDSAEAVLERARSIREHDIPCDILHLDCYWQRFGCWSDLLWDTEMFPDPQGMLAELKAMGFKVCLWINPYIGIKSERFVEPSEKGYFLKNPQGEAYVVDIWGGFHPPVGIIDVTHPEAVNWFKSLLREHLQIGVDVFKTDFGEGIPADAVPHSGIDGKDLHNLYALLYNDAVAEVTAEVTGHTGLVWARSSYAGGQRHTAQWSGDVNCTFTGLASTLRGGLSMAICGHAFWSHDIGGFTIQPEPDLYTRWAQFGLLSPLTRAHGNTTRLPWDYGETALSVFQHYARLRYRLLPYLYSYAWVAAQTSLPLMRPMLLEFPEDPVTWALDLQYMLGEELLVAPIFNQSGERAVYLPAGQWVDFWTDELLTGSRFITVKTPLETMPLYVRANALIPTVEPRPFTLDTAFTDVTFDAYLLDVGSFALYDSDGMTQISASRTGNELHLRLSGAKSHPAFRLLLLKEVAPVEVVYVNDNLVQQESEVGWCWDRLEDGSLLVHFRQ